MTEGTTLRVAVPRLLLLGVRLVPVLVSEVVVEGTEPEGLVFGRGDSMPDHSLVIDLLLVNSCALNICSLYSTFNPTTGLHIRMVKSFL